MSTASADLIVQYRSDDMSSYAPLNAFDWHDNLNTPTAFDRRDTQWTGPSGMYAFGNWKTTIDPLQYVGFKVSAESDYELHLTSLTGVTTAGQSGSGLTSFVWGYRIDHNNDGVFDQDWSFGRIYTPEDSDFTNFAAAKNWIFEQPIVTQGTVEFGVFASGSTASAMLEVFRGNLFLNGEIVPAAVPEPATYALGMALVLGGMAVMRSRKRKSAVSADASAK